MGIHVVAARLVLAITNPTERRGVGRERGERDQAPRCQRRLVRGRRWKAGRERRRTVAGENTVSGVAEIESQPPAQEHFAVARVQQKSETLTAEAARQLDLPAQA